MSWVRTSDDEYEWPAISSLSDAAARLWTNARQYACRTMSDGFVPIDQPARLVKLRAPKKTILELVDAGLWHDEHNGMCAECLGERARAKAIPTRGAGYVIHGYFPEQLPRHKVIAEREAARRRMERIRSGGVRPNDGEVFGRTIDERSPDVRGPRTPGTQSNSSGRGYGDDERSGEVRANKRPNKGGLKQVGAAAEAMKLDLLRSAPIFPRDRFDAVAESGALHRSTSERA